MEVGKLKSAIRNSRTKVFVLAPIAPGLPPMSLVLEKNALLDELSRAFPQSKTQETGLMLRSNGQIVPDDCLLV